MKKRKVEAAYIPNQRDKNPHREWFGHSNEPERKLIEEEDKRRKKFLNKPQ